MIAITSNKAFVLKNNVIYNQTGYVSAHGTGRYAVVACHYVTKDIPTTFRLVAELDPMSSMHYTYVLANTLTPFVME